MKLHFKHEKIVNLCKKLSLECYFIGIEFNKVTKDSFINTDDFEKYLDNKPLCNKTILLKGSRGVELEKLVSFL